MVMPAFDRLRQVIDDPHKYCQEWKSRTGKKAVGYLCTYIPEELLYAAGILPVRVLSRPENIEVVGRHIPGNYCPHSRGCLAQGLQGKYSYLDGLVDCHGCQQMLQTFYSWQKHMPLPFSHRVFVPQHRHHPQAADQLYQELVSLKSSLEEWTEEPVTDEALAAAIQVYNTNRRLMREIYERRKKDPPALSGSETFELVLSSMLMDKEEHSQLLEQVLRELGPRQGDGKARVMLVGSVTQDIELYRLIESLGGEIVIDDDCIGTRYFWNDVIVNGNSLAAIGSRYLDRPPCPLWDLDPQRERCSYALKLAQEYRVQGAIFARLKFCDPHGYDIPAMKATLKDNDIPSLVIETDITLARGQLRTRIEAFLEMLV
jgi:benzoyl-CoA reductase subunit C